MVLCYIEVLPESLETPNAPLQRVVEQWKTQEGIKTAIIALMKMS